MSVDVVCTGTVFLDLTFEGLNELPETGRERLATELHETPGGAAITAVGARAARAAARRGRAARARRAPATHAARGARADGVDCAGPESSARRSPSCCRSRATARWSPSSPRPPSIAAAIARARAARRRHQRVALDLVPHGARGYATVGDAEAERRAQRSPPELGRLRALLAERPSEALRLTGHDDAGGRRARSRTHVETVVVSRGAAGARRGVRRRARPASGPHGRGPGHDRSGRPARRRLRRRRPDGAAARASGSSGRSSTPPSPCEGHRGHERGHSRRARAGARTSPHRPPILPNRHP